MSSIIIATPHQYHNLQHYYTTPVPQHTTHQHATPHHTTSHFTTSHHTTSHHTTPHHTTPHHTTPHHITPNHITLHHITPHHITPHYTASQGFGGQPNFLPAPRPHALFGYPRDSNATDGEHAEQGAAGVGRH